MQKFLVQLNDRYNDAIIFSDVYKADQKEESDPIVYKHNVREVLLYVRKRDEQGNISGDASAIYLNADDILKLANKIQALRNTAASKEAYINIDDDLPF